MPALSHRQQKIQEKRKQTSWKDFIKEIASRRPLTFYRWSGLISKYPNTSRIQAIQSTKSFEVMRDSLVSMGLEYESSRSFFQNFQLLFFSFPQEAILRFGEYNNTEFADVVYDSQNVYLGYFVVYDCENILYSFVVREGCKNVHNSMMVYAQSENIFNCSGVIKGYNVFYSKYIHNSSNIWFSSNLQGCSECIRCDGLTNMSYCIDNHAYPKGEYFEKKAKFLAQKSNFNTRFEGLNQKAEQIGSDNVSGGWMIDAHDVEEGEYSYNVRNARNIMFVGGEQTNTQMHDVFIGGASYSDHLYGINGTGSSEHAYLCNVGLNNFNVYYSIGLEGCSYCLGCIRLQNKSYCILNKQYTKEERHEKVDEIFQSMEDEGVLGEFFPAWMNPFYFNETAASLIEDYTKDEILEDGFLWNDDDAKVDIPEGMQVVKSEELGRFEGTIKNGEFVSSDSTMCGSSQDPDFHQDDGGIWSIDPEVLKKVIHDEEGNLYRIIPMEYKFLKKYGLPLPRKHRLRRLKQHFLSK